SRDWSSDVCSSDYEVEVADIGQDVKVGDYGYIVAEDLGIRVQVRVVRLLEYEDETKNKAELNYFVEGLEALQEDSVTRETPGDIQMVVTYNETDINVTSVYNPVVELAFTSYAPTNMQIGLTILGYASTDMLLEGYFDISGNKVGRELKQEVKAGWNTITMNFLILQVEEGADFLRFFLKSNTGTFSIERDKIELYIMAKNLLGGTSAKLPRANVVEEVEFVDAISVSDVPSISLQTPTSRLITENVIFQLPYPTDRGGLVVLGAENREDFADMSRYTDYTYVPAQENVDDFIDNLYSAYSLFYVVALGDSIYVVTTIGKWIDFDTINNTVRSDGEMFALGYEEGMEQVRNWGRFIDFSDRQLNLEVIEVFNR